MIGEENVACKRKAKGEKIEDELKQLNGKKMKRKREGQWGLTKWVAVKVEVGDGGGLVEEIIGVKES